MVGLAFEAARPAGNGLATEGAEGIVAAGFFAGWEIVPVPVDVAGNEEVEVAVTVVVAPGGRAGPVAELDAGLLGDISECAVMIVAIEAIFADVGDVDIGPAVVVEIGDGDAGAPAIVGDSGLGGDVCECAVVVVAKERGVGWGGFAGERVDCGAVDNIDGEPAGVVVIDEAERRSLWFRRCSFCLGVPILWVQWVRPPLFG